jgi:hypothetical protein
VVDLFEEVDEQLRSDHYLALARRYWPWIVGVLAVALAAALGVWGYGQYRTGGAMKASEAYGRGLDDLGRGAASQAFADFQDAANSHSAIYRSLALMQQAGIRLDQKRTAEAVGLFDSAAKSAPDVLVGDAARLKSAFALLDTAPYGEVEARLKPLADEKRPYYALAREALAMAELRAGKTSAARDDFAALTLLADAPDDVRQRAQAAMALIDSGTASAIPATVKAALILPTPSPAPANLNPTGPQADQTPAAGADQ